MKPSLPAPSHVIADKYVVERSLGQGGMGAVYLVSHKVTGKKLALKCLLPQFVENAELVQRFLREAQAAGRIQHRHVVDVFDVGRDASVLYIVMPLLEGKPLSLILREESLDLTAILAILLRAMEGVVAAHAQGIVHRDLKPDNIFVCVGPSGQLDDPRVLDFGISKLDGEEERTLTQSGVLMGTPHYMSFEQLNSQRDIDARADIYALGCILYEASAGELPYVAESAPALAIRMLTSDPVDLAARRPDLPAGLAQVVMKAISRERSERHQSVEALIAELSPFVPEHSKQTDEGRLSRGRVQADSSVRRRAMAEEATVAADMPARAQPAGPEAETRLEKNQITSNPQLKLLNESEDNRKPRSPTSPLRRSTAVVALLIAASAATFALWRLADSQASPPPQPGRGRAAASESATGAEPSADNEQNIIRTVRKVRRKKSNAAAAQPEQAQPLDPTGISANPGKAHPVLDEWEEVEEEVFEQGPDTKTAAEVPAQPTQPSDPSEAEEPSDAPPHVAPVEALPDVPAAESTTRSATDLSAEPSPAAPTLPDALNAPASTPQ